MLLVEELPSSPMSSPYLSPRREQEGLRLGAGTYPAFQLQCSQIPFSVTMATLPVWGRAAGGAALGSLLGKVTCFSGKMPTRHPQPSSARLSWAPDAGPSGLSDTLGQAEGTGLPAYTRGQSTRPRTPPAPDEGTGASALPGHPFSFGLLLLWHTHGFRASATATRTLA